MAFQRVVPMTGDSSDALECETNHSCWSWKDIESRGPAESQPILPSAYKQRDKCSAPRPNGRGVFFYAPGCRRSGFIEGSRLKQVGGDLVHQAQQFGGLVPSFHTFMTELTKRRIRNGKIQRYFRIWIQLSLFSSFRT